jgi:CheY-like chemotaxis protein
MDREQERQKRPSWARSPDVIALVNKWCGLQPRLVLGHTNEAYRSQASRYFRSLGLNLATAGSAQEIHQLTRVLDPAVVIVDAELPDESGYLTCVKIKQQFPQCKVIVLGCKATKAGERFAAFAGANAFVDRSEGLETLGQEVLGAAVSAAC